MIIHDHKIFEDMPNNNTCVVISIITVNNKIDFIIYYLLFIINYQLSTIYYPLFINT